MKIIYPLTATTTAFRLEVCYQLDEQLRLENNAMGAKLRAGEITRAEWDAYQRDTFDPTSKAIQFEITKNRALAEKSTYWAVDIKTAVVKEVAEI